MKTLYLNRHAKSSWKDHSLRDIQRPLNKRGKINAAFMAERSAQENDIDLFVTSPAERALRTAQQFVKYAEIDVNELRIKEEIYGAGVHEMLQIIADLPPAADSVMLFGHNPTFSDLAHYLDRSFHAHLVTCARVKIVFEVDEWEAIGMDSGQVVAHHYPRMYPEMENL